MRYGLRKRKNRRWARKRADEAGRVWRSIADAAREDVVVLAIAECAGEGGLDGRVVFIECGRGKEQVRLNSD
jgi:hypothetical protein